MELKNSVHSETLSRKELWPALWVLGPVPLMVTLSPGLGKTLPKKPPISQHKLRLFQNTITGWSPSFVLEGPFFLYVSSSVRLSHQCVSFLGGKGMKTGGDHSSEASKLYSDPLGGPSPFIPFQALLYTRASAALRKEAVKNSFLFLYFPFFVNWESLSTCAT